MSAKEHEEMFRSIMLNWAILFLIIGLIAGLLGISGVAGTATYMAYVC